MTWTKMKDHPSMREDEKGNILQRTGAVVPKACQKCGRKLIALIEKIERTQSYPTYKCEDCKFKNNSADYAWDHEKANSSHTIKKIKELRIIGYQTYLSGALARVEGEGEDTTILCDNCKHGTRL